MIVKQISVFVENKAGRLAQITSILASEGINIQALSIADTTDFGILRIIVDKPDKAVEVLRKNEFTAAETDVIAVSIEDTPGGLAKALKVLDKEGIGIEYMYAFTEKRRDDALVILRIENNQKAVEVLNRAGIDVVPSEVVYNL
jgi:hypothetical protein